VRGEGGLKERSIRQLSGGERRRVALALALGFADLTAGRGQLRCNLIVLDEVHPALLMLQLLLRSIHVDVTHRLVMLALVEKQSKSR